MITFTVPGQPRGKGRPRFARIGGYVKAYTPEETASYESLIRLAYYRAGGRVHKNALKMTVAAFYAVPVSWSRKRSQRALDGTERPTVKPDADNVIKIICDALNDTAYRDDKQIVEVICTKHYADTPKVVVTIEEVTDARETS